MTVDRSRDARNFLILNAGGLLGGAVGWGLWALFLFPILFSGWGLVLAAWSCALGFKSRLTYKRPIVALFVQSAAVGAPGVVLGFVMLASTAELFRESPHVAWTLLFVLAAALVAQLASFYFFVLWRASSRTPNGS